MSKKPHNKCFLFSGPTRAVLCNPDAEDIVWLPPVQRGDVERLTKTEPPGDMAIVDGVFHHCPCVGHAELRCALEAGWRIWGLSSMGAIRAAEMHIHGMVGFGKVATAFLDDDSLRDDEVTLLHEQG